VSPKGLAPGAGDQSSIRYNDENCDMLSVLFACKSQLVLLHGKTRYVILVDVIQTLMCFNDWSSVSVRQEVKNLQ
jgi:hypothetical protein